MPDPSYLAATRFIEADAPTIQELAHSLRQPTEQRTAVAMFDWVRDHIKYDATTALDPPERYLATAILARGSGYCVQKAVLLAALTRAVQIPSRLGFADVRNHKLSERWRRMLGTNLFVYHGYVELWLNHRWVKATPAFDRETTARAGALLVQLDGENDALLHPVDPEGSPHIEYVGTRGTFADLPLVDIQKTFLEVYQLDEPMAI